VGLVVALFIRSDIDLTVAPVRNPTYVTLSDGEIRNIYEVRLRNMKNEPTRFNFSVKGDPSLFVTLEGTPYTSVEVAPDEMKLQRVYVTAPQSSDPAQADRTEIRIWVEDTASGTRDYKDTVFNGRGQ